METLELLNKTPKEMIELMRKEIDMINSMKVEPMEYVFLENKETKVREKVLVKSSELIIKALMEKRQRNVTSRKYSFKCNDVLSYSDANIYKTELTNNGYKKTVKHSQKYNDYAKLVKDFFEDNNKDDMLSYFLKQEKLMIIIEFSLCNIQKDNDNVTKPFIDCLFFNVNRNDNNIKRIYSSVKKSFTGEDMIEFQLIKLTENNWESGIFIEDTEYQKDEYFYESTF